MKVTVAMNPCRQNQHGYYMNRSKFDYVHILIFWTQRILDPVVIYIYINFKSALGIFRPKNGEFSANGPTRPYPPFSSHKKTMGSYVYAIAGICQTGLHVGLGV